MGRAVQKEQTKGFLREGYLQYHSTVESLMC